MNVQLPPSTTVNIGPFIIFYTLSSTNYQTITMVIYDIKHYKDISNDERSVNTSYLGSRVDVFTACTNTRLQTEMNYITLRDECNFQMLFSSQQLTVMFDCSDPTIK